MCVFMEQPLALKRWMLRTSEEIRGPMLFTLAFILQPGDFLAYLFTFLSGLQAIRATFALCSNTVEPLSPHASDEANPVSKNDLQTQILCVSH